MKKLTALGKELTKQEQKQILGGLMAGGGGTCAAYLPNGFASGTNWGGAGGVPFSNMTFSNGTYTVYGVSKGVAMAQVEQMGGRWCCDSCITASWYHQ